jgi:hypothetical protein
MLTLQQITQTVSLTDEDPAGDAIRIIAEALGLPALSTGEPRRWRVGWGIAGDDRAVLVALMQAHIFKQTEVGIPKERLDQSPWVTGLFAPDRRNRQSS